MWEKAEKFLAKDKYIGPIIKKHGPCKIEISKNPDYFFDLVDSIVSQQLSGKAAATCYTRARLCFITGLASGLNGCSTGATSA